MLAEVTDVLGPGDDDVAFLVARVSGEPVPFEVEIPADPSELSALRRRLRTWFERHGFDQVEVDEILLAVSEACNNAIEHAYGENREGPIHVRVDRDAETLRVVVEDHGMWRDPTPSDERGRGLMLIQAPDGFDRRGHRLCTGRG